MGPKPEVTLEFDLGDVIYMRPPTGGVAGTVAPKETLVLRDKSSHQQISIFAVIDGVRIVPIAVVPDTDVTLVVSR